MKISTKGRYGLRTLVDIALHQQGGPVTLKDIAERQQISPKYLWQILNPLRAAGLLSVVRGARGGYLLARDPTDITLLEMVTLLEGPISLVDCVAVSDVCEKALTCPARTIWDDVNDVLIRAMQGITLEHVVQRCRNAITAVDYVI